jgi:hypothetical protein
VFRVRSLVAHPDRLDDLVLGIDGSLGVVALEVAVRAFHDVVDGVRVGAAIRAAVIPLGLGFGVAVGIGGQATRWQVQRAPGRQLRFAQTGGLSVGDGQILCPSALCCIRSARWRLRSLPLASAAAAA